MVCSWDGTGFGPTAVSQQLLELDDDERNAVFTVMLARKPRLQPRFGVSFSLQFANRPRATMARRDGPPDIGSQEPRPPASRPGFSTSHPRSRHLYVRELLPVLPVLYRVPGFVRRPGPRGGNGRVIFIVWVRASRLPFDGA